MTMHLVQVVLRIIFYNIHDMRYRFQDGHQYIKINVGASVMVSINSVSTTVLKLVLRLLEIILVLGLVYSTVSTG